MANHGVTNRPGSVFQMFPLLPAAPVSSTLTKKTQATVSVTPCWCLRDKEEKKREKRKRAAGKYEKKKN